MNGINKTLYIPLYGKAAVSKKGIILSDAMAERIWAEESFPIQGKAKSKWLTYNMAMRARIFDDWTEEMLRRYPDALVLHIGCGLDSRCLRVKTPYSRWIDGDFEDGDIVNIVTPQGKRIAVGRSAFSSDTAKRLIGQHDQKPLVHYDYLAML